MYTTNRNNIRQIMIMIMIICCIISYVVYNYRSSVSNNIKNNKQDEVSNSQKNTVKSIDKYKPVIVEHINNLMKDTSFNECLDYDYCNITINVKSSKPKRTNQLNNFVINSKLKPVPRPNIKANFKPKDDCNIQFL